MSMEPFFDPAESCLDKLERGPFGIFAGITPASQNNQPKHNPKHNPKLIHGAGA